MSNPIDAIKPHDPDDVDAEVARLVALCPVCYGCGKRGGCVHCGRVSEPSKGRGRYGRGFRQARIEPH